MPTNDERREVAEIMRYMAEDTLSGYSFQRAVESVVFGQLGNRTWRQVLSRLADLIEPEPICIANITFTAEQKEELFQRVMEEFRVNGCPNCGAKVVGE